MNKYMSIITNFGCHWKCPYCIVRENKIGVPKTNITGLDNLIKEIKASECNIVSLSGGGDPVHDFDKNTEYYNKLFKLLEENNLPLELHTSYVKSNFPMDKCCRVVYHLRDIDQLYDIKRIGNEKVRAVFVITSRFTVGDLINITRAVECLDDIDELSFRQMVNDKYETMEHNHETLVWGHNKGLWHYIEQNDYNLYYVNGIVYNKFSDIKIQ